MGNVNLCIAVEIKHLSLIQTEVFQNSDSASEKWIQQIFGLIHIWHYV